jgi:hypothetical protein
MSSFVPEDHLAGDSISQGCPLTLPRLFDPFADDFEFAPCPPSAMATAPRIYVIPRAPTDACSDSNRSPPEIDQWSDLADPAGEMDGTPHDKRDMMLLGSNFSSFSSASTTACFSEMSYGGATDMVRALSHVHRSLLSTYRGLFIGRSAKNQNKKLVRHTLEGSLNHSYLLARYSMCMRRTSDPDLNAMQKRLVGANNHPDLIGKSIATDTASRNASGTDEVLRRASSMLHFLQTCIAEPPPIGSAQVPAGTLSICMGVFKIHRVE